ncbi:MAG: response regulator [Patescibacteria group bacterium]
MGKKILVADDERNIVLLVKVNLERQGYDVITAADGEECLDRVRSEKPDLIVLDIFMPKLDGFGVLKAIREAPDTADLPVIILSQEDEDRVSSGDRVDMYIPKPFDPRDLIALVKSILGD